MVPLAKPLNAPHDLNLSGHPINFLLEDKEHSWVDNIRKYRQNASEDGLAMVSSSSSFSSPSLF